VEVLGVGLTEILLILLVALIFIGPERLPELAERLGKGLAKLRAEADILQDTLHEDTSSASHHPLHLPRENGPDTPDKQ